jgi:ubiquinone/menaquinone biosynthesis C-methylase UbiE
MTTFKDLEQSGWTNKALAYDHHFALVADQAIDAILSGVGDVAGLELLDICCGTGNLAAAAAVRGARVTAIDFAPTMIDIARVKAPGIRFEVGDAEALRFASGSFDVALCSFGLWHLAEPDRALAEAARVLKDGGIYAYSTWLPPQRGFEMFALVLKAIQAHGTMEVDLPPAPPPFRFADESEAKRALTAQGFIDISFATETAHWIGTNGEELIDFIYKAIVRTPMLIQAQTPNAQLAIHREIKTGAEAMRVDGRIRMRWPYLVGCARRR